MWLMLFYPIIIIFIVILYLLKKNNNYWKSRGIPQDKPIIFFGSFLKVALRKQHSSERIRDIYFEHASEPYVGFYGFTKPLLLVRDPEILKKILVKDFNKFINRISILNKETDPLAYYSIFNLRGNQWRTMRNKLTPVFTSGKLKLMLPLMMECCQNLHGIMKNSSNKTIEFKDLMKRYSVDIISSCAFGINANCLKSIDSEIFENAVRFVDQQSLFRNLSMICYLFLPKLVDLFGLTFFDIKSTNNLFEIFKATLREREIRNIERNDFINILKNLSPNNENFVFDDLQMAAQAITFFGAGTITTTMTISCTLYELALNKTIQSRLRDEITKSYEVNSGFTYETISQMKYLQTVICETQRKYPFGVFANRVAIDDYIIEETGLKIEKGTSIIVPVFGLHSDPKYFPDPHKYDPERFNDENKQKIIPFTYMPFGEGPRNCLGRRFAMLSTKIALIYLIKDFQFDISEKSQIPLRVSKTSLFFQTEDGIPLKINSI